MEMIRHKVCVGGLTKEQTDLRFELFDWLKNKGLSVEQAVALLNVTASQIIKSAEKQLL